MNTTSTDQREPRSRRWRRAATAITWVTTVIVVAGGGIIAPAVAQAAPSQPWRPAVQREPSVPGTDLKASAKPLPAMPDTAVPAATWPGTGAAEVAVPTGEGSWAKAGDLPVLIGAAGSDAAVPKRVRVELLDRAVGERVGVSGPLLALRRADGGTASGRLSVRVDYSPFRAAFGGDWASRLKLVQLPACMLAPEEAPGCGTGVAVPSRNDVRAGRLSAELSVTGEVSLLAATAGASGGAGDYTATSLSASASWKAGDSSGTFSWSYPMRTPPALSGPDPDIALSYSSGEVDGRTASTNNQASWIGEGWGLSPGFVERRYKSCADDVSFTPKPGDLCWETNNAFLTLGGKSVELVRDDTTGAWHPRDDDGARVERFTGAVNGDNDGEYWRVTTMDGTQYFFGLNRLPGWVSGNPLTNSAWTVPVFGNDAGEPCHADTFTASYCTQAWRWNLDYVVDPHANAMSYFYARETNYYGRNLTASAATQYDRGGYLARIDYGQRSSTMYSASAPMRVVFAVDERCAAGATCTTGDITTDTAKNWPDVPFDRICKAGASCTNQYAPTFFSRKRLASVTTQVLSGTAYRDVDAWTLTHQFPPSGDGTAPALWLASIIHTGKVGGSLAVPAVTFMGVQLENRVDALEGIAPMYKWRVSDAYDESGGHVRAIYSAKECTRSALPAPESNTKRCFPQYWVPEGALQPQLDWFHKYVAVQVLEDDRSGVAGIEQTDYEYLGGGAWHYDDNELTPAKYRTWSQWRGLARVRVTHGATGGVRSQSETLYLRGMDGDKQPTGTRSVSVIDSEGGTVTDHPALAGFAREELTFTGLGGGVLAGTINDPWISAATATHGATKAYLVDVAAKRSRTALAAGGWRRTETRTTFDGYGLPTQVDDLGDTATAADDRCTRTGYARNTSAWMLNYVSREETVGVACAVTPSYPADAISDDRTFYDGGAFGAAPTKGDVTRTEEVASYSGGTPSYVQASRSSYDAYGRVLDAFDALDRKTATAYTPASGGPVTGTTVTNPLDHATTTTLEPVWGSPVAQVDANGRRTDLAYDPLGRLTSVWLPDRSKAGGATPNTTFSYLVQDTAPVVVTTKTLRDDDTYEPSYAFYDGRLRPRQTQSVAPDGGRVVTDTFYDSRGLAARSNAAYWNSDTAGTTLLTVTDNTVPGQAMTVHDGAERPTAAILLSYGAEKWRTTTAYGGDRVTVAPPTGATPTTTVTDADGRTVELRQYTSGSPTGGYDATRYAYTKAGQLATVTDAAGNVWRYTYDVRGRKVTAADPDSGTTTYTYDNADQVLTSTDARGTTLAYGYDSLGRKTGVYEGSTASTRRATWTYDTLAKGYPTSSTRYESGNAYTVAVNGYDARYRSRGTTVTIPPSEGPLAGTYKSNTGYTATGRPSLVSYPAAGGMVAETLHYTYDAAGRLRTADVNSTTLLTAASYSPYGEPLQYTLSAAAGKELAQTFFYEDGTRRLARAAVDRNVSPLHLADVNYTYDPAGNVIKVADSPADGPADTQCFGYDHLRRLTQAWTATDACAAAPSTSVIGGPAPYWQSWTYDKTGNRLTETDHVAGQTATSTYPAAGSARPHALSTVSSGGDTDSFDYDAAGNTTGRTVNGSAQTLTWDPEGHLATVTEAGRTTSYLYDADGNRLIRRDATAVTAYLGSSELTLTRSTGTVTTTRYYGIGTATAVRTSAGLSFLTGDHHGTASLAVAANDLTYSQRRYLPFGKLRGTAPTGWPGEKGFVGGTVDSSTGLTHLGAREYDPANGRFISVDPIINPADPQQMNGYAYSNNSPETFTDPEGTEHFCDGCQSSGSGDHHYRPPARKKKKSSGSSGNHYCDGCHYGGSGKHHYKPQKKRSHSYGNHYCDGCHYGGSGKHHYHRPNKRSGRICDGCQTLPRVRVPAAAPEQTCTLIAGSYRSCTTSGGGGGEGSGLKGFAVSALRLWATAVKYSPYGQAADLFTGVTGISAGLCVGGDAVASGAAIGSVCYISTPSGESGLAISGGGGLGAPIGAGISVGPTFSNARHLHKDFGGQSAYLSGSVGEGPAVGGSFGWGQNSEGRTIYQVTPSAGPLGTPPVLPFLYSGGTTYTWTIDAYGG